MECFKRLLFLIPLGLTLPSCSPEEPPIEPDLVVDILAGEQDRFDTLVSLPLDQPWATASVVEVTGGLFTPLPAQVDPSARKLYWILNDETPRGTARVFNIYGDQQVPIEATPLRLNRITVQDLEERHLQVDHRGTPVFRYNYGTVEPPDSQKIPAVQARNAYIHPLWTPSGAVVTDDFNPDHLHQRGIWFAWTETQFEGRTPDFWNLGEGTGTVRFKELVSLQQGAVFGGFKVTQEHVDLSAPGGARAALIEDWTLRVYSVGGKNRGFFIFDLESEQRVAGTSPLILPEYHYGGLGVRGAREWTPGQVTFLTSEGKGREEGDGSRADWCALFGSKEDRYAGMAVFSHPENFRSPQPLRIHPEMPYFAFSPTRLGEMRISPGEPLGSRYRILAFDGRISSNLASAYWLDYIDPPQIQVR